MIRALIWKEWREHRWTFVGFLVLLVCLKQIMVLVNAWSIEQGSMSVWAQSLIATSIGVPLLGAVLGASTVASERGAGTLGFLLTRPLDWRLLFGVKAGVAVAYLVAGSLAAVLLLNDRPGFGFDAATPWLLRFYVPVVATAFMALGASFVASQLAAATVPAVLMGAGLTFCIAMTAFALDLREPYVALNLGLGLGLLGVGAFASAGRRQAGLGARFGKAAVGLVALTLLAYPALHAWSALSQRWPGRLAVVQVTATPGGVVLLGSTEGLGLEPHVQAARAARTPGGALSAPTWLPCSGNQVPVAWSPDGRLMAVEDQRTHWGFAGRTERLAVLDERGERCWEGAPGHYLGVKWAPSGDLLAFVFSRLERGTAPRQVCIYDHASRGVRVLPLPLKPSEQPSVVGFCRGSAALLVLRDPERTGARVRLVEVPLDGGSTVEHQPFDPTERPCTFGRLDTGEWVFVVGDSLVAWRPGARRTLLQVPEGWQARAIAPSGAVVAAWRCSAEWETSRIRLRDYSGAVLDLGLVEVPSVGGSAVATAVPFASTTLCPSLLGGSTLEWSEPDRGFLYSVRDAVGSLTVRVIEPGTRASRDLLAAVSL